MPQASGPRSVDPRHIITPDAFRVADGLIGTPLATPARRLFAMLVDLVCVGLLALLLEAPGLIPATIGAILIYRFTRGQNERAWTRFLRRGIGCFGALLVFSAAIAAWDALFDEDGSDATEARQTQERLASIDSILAESGVDIEVAGPAQMDATAEESAPPETQLAGAADRAGTAAPISDTAVADTGVADTAAQGRDTVARLNTRVAELETQVQEQRRALGRAEQDMDRVRDQAEEEIEQMREETERGPLRQMMALVADDLGIGLGWLGLYFTAFLVLGRGQTPGKRIARIRVIRLDAEPIGWWIALQRFGGYSASFFTGLVGFIEIFWDANRQGLQDKLVHTVVVDETGRRARPRTPGDPADATRAPGGTAGAARQRRRGSAQGSDGAAELP